MRQARRFNESAARAVNSDGDNRVYMLTTKVMHLSAHWRRRIVATIGDACCNMKAMRLETSSTPT